MDKWCTTPGCLARLSIEGRAPFSSLGEEATEQMDGGVAVPSFDPRQDRRRLTVQLR